jgi:hypothetical protein
MVSIDCLPKSLYEMKTFLTLLSCSLFSFTAVQAQTVPDTFDLLKDKISIRPAVSVTVNESPKPMVINCDCGSKKPEDQPVYVIDDKQTADELRSLNPNQIENIEVSRDEKWIKKYGDQAKNGVIFITMKKPATGIGPVQ